ncbi:hypothetical protein Ancab_038341, partial [Ancistrocladus abbreviatus]
DVVHQVDIKGKGWRETWNSSNGGQHCMKGTIPYYFPLHLDSSVMIASCDASINSTEAILAGVLRNAKGDFSQSHSSGCASF